MPVSIYGGLPRLWPRIIKDLGVHAAWDNFSTSHGQPVSHRVHVFAFKCLFNHRQQLAPAEPDDKHHLRRGRAGCVRIRRAGAGFGLFQRKCNLFFVIKGLFHDDVLTSEMEERPYA